jgi:AcrR family transcriptional regulator
MPSSSFNQGSPVPISVNHDERRREVIEAATQLLLTDGRSALTVRRVAAEVGWSTKVVSYYFADMSDLLYATYDGAAARARARLAVVEAADPTDVQGMLEALLPLDVARRRDWTIWLSFWSEALTSEAFANDQRQRARTTQARLAKMLTRLSATGRLDLSVDIGLAARKLGALIPGIASQAMFDTTRWTAARQREVVTSELAALGISAR